MSYKATNSYALFSDSLKGEQTIELSVDNNLDRSGGNEPVLSENMIPVYYDETNDVWRKADSKNESLAYKWYDYDKKMWANSVTVSSSSSETTLTLDDGSTKSCSGSTCVRSDYVSAPLGTAIPMEDILTMQVWIPRYTYEVWNYNKSGTVGSEPQEIKIKFEEGTNSSGEIICEDSISGTDGNPSETCKVKSSGTECTDSLCNGKKYTHPAFTFGTEELTGFWIGKFEVSSNIECTAVDDSMIEKDCNLRTIKPLVKPNVTSWRGAMIGAYENNMMTMNDSGNIYGFLETDDTHMIKNMEWGAVAYLSHSKYGINHEVNLNSNSNYITGCGSQSEESTSSGTICNSYETELGMSSSATGNIYGVYDMSGGSADIVMGNIISPDGVTMMSGYRGSANQYSGYTGIVYFTNVNEDYLSYTGLYTYPNNEYIDKYSFSSDTATVMRSKLGDAIKEVYSTGNYEWYNDRSYLANNNYSWFNRGGNYSNGVDTGVFNSYINYGSASTFRSSRLVISQ